MKPYFVLFFLWVMFSGRLFAVSGELNLSYQQMFGGYGSSFFETSSLARYFNSFFLDDEGNYTGSGSAKLKQPSFNVGLEGVLLVPIAQTNKVSWHFVSSYAVKYDHSRYSLPLIARSGAAGKPTDDNLFGNETYMYNAITNQANAGVRVTGINNGVYGQFTLGGLLYTPFNAVYTRIDTNQANRPAGRWSVSGNQTGWIPGYLADTGLADKYEFNLRGSSEILMVLEARVGYKFVYAGFSYATNVRVNTFGVQLGFTLAPWGGSTHE